MDIAIHTHVFAGLALVDICNVQIQLAWLDVGVFALFVLAESISLHKRILGELSFDVSG